MVYFHFTYYVQLFMANNTDFSLSVEVAQNLPLNVLLKCYLYLGDTWMRQKSLADGDLQKMRPSLLSGMLAGLSGGRKARGSLVAFAVDSLPLGPPAPMCLNQTDLDSSSGRLS